VSACQNTTVFDELFFGFVYTESIIFVVVIILIFFQFYKILKLVNFI